MTQTIKPSMIYKSLFNEISLSYFRIALEQVGLQIPSQEQLRHHPTP